MVARTCDVHASECMLCRSRGLTIRGWLRAHCVTSCYPTKTVGARRPVGNLNLCVGLLSLRGTDHALGANVEIFDCDFAVQHNSAVDAQLQWVVSDAGTLMFVALLLACGDPIGCVAAAVGRVVRSNNETSTSNAPLRV